MTNETLQTNDTKAGDTETIRLLVAMEMSLKTWRLVMPEAGKAKKHLAGIETATGKPAAASAEADASSTPTGSYQYHQPWRQGFPRAVNAWTPTPSFVK